MDRWKAIRLYATLNSVYLLFLAAYVLLHFHFGNLYDLFLFYFDASYDDFQLWFPRHHGLLFGATVGIKLGAVVLAGISAWKVYRNLGSLRAHLLYNASHGYVNFLRAEGSVLAAGLLLYLSVYACARASFNGPLFSDLQVLVARGFLLHLSVQALIVFIVHWNRFATHVRHFLLEPQAPFNLAVLRILFFTYLAFLYWTKQFSALSMVGLENRVALPGIGWLIEMLPISPSLYLWAVYAGIFASLMVAIGFGTRLFLIANALLCFYIITTPNFFGKLWHEQLIIWIAWFLTFSRCADVLSIDALLKPQRVTLSADYTYPVRLIWLQLSFIYFWAGFYKLWDSGFDWALGSSMINQVQLEWLQHYDRVPSIRIDKWPLLLHMGGLAAILFELGYVLLVLRPQWRWAAAIAGLSMHNIIGYFMYISFSMMLQAFYIFYVDFNGLFRSRMGAFGSIPLKQYSRPALLFGLVILSTNFLFGMFSIDSYPFSAYPKYSALIPDTIPVLKWKAHCPNGSLIDAHDVGKSNGFRWEDYGWLEYNLIRDHLGGTDVSARIHTYWAIWCSHNPQLSQCDSVEVSLVKRPLSPEGAAHTVDCGKLATIIP